MRTDDRRQALTTCSLRKGVTGVKTGRLPENELTKELINYRDSLKANVTEQLKARGFIPRSFDEQSS